MLTTARRVRSLSNLVVAIRNAVMISHQQYTSVIRIWGEVSGDVADLGAHASQAAKFCASVNLKVNFTFRLL